MTAVCDATASYMPTFPMALGTGQTQLVTANATYHTGTVYDKTTSTSPEIIATGQPDAEGNVIPASVGFGGYQVRKVDVRAGQTVTTEALVFDRRSKNYLTFYNTCCGITPGSVGFSLSSFTGSLGFLGTAEAQGQDYCGGGTVGLPATFSSGNPAVSTVSSAGDVTGVSPGSTFTNTSVTYFKQKTVDTCTNASQSNSAPTNVKPVITGPHTVWWFNGQNPNSSTWPTQITLSTSGSGNWTVNSGSSEVHLSGTSGSSITVQGTGTFSQQANDVSISVSVNGVTSAPFYLTSDGPKLLANPSSISLACTGASEQGWEYDKTYRVLDNFNNPMKGLPVSEGLDLTPKVWPLPTPTGGTTDLTTGNFPDSIFVCALPNELTPMPQNYVDGSGTTLVDQIPQAWCAGSSTSGSVCTGASVQSDTIKRYLEHGAVTIP